MIAVTPYTVDTMDVYQGLLVRCRNGSYGCWRASGINNGKGCEERVLVVRPQTVSGDSVSHASIPCKQTSGNWYAKHQGARYQGATSTG